ncbi:hypothetical protein ATANTOWER_030737 [Ataeniobius toweri]|uniref:Uncharacterized protein n=1 Tax=Ataeniobius toweri TaxID=208326 RepID=A0ABU7B104_9TELE|nr:hypothetical protein [Ataeniobius toweri]
MAPLQESTRETSLIITSAQSTDGKYLIQLPGLSSNLREVAGHNTIQTRLRAGFLSVEDLDSSNSDLHLKSEDR